MKTIESHGTDRHVRLTWLRCSEITRFSFCSHWCHIIMVVVHSTFKEWSLNYHLPRHSNVFSIIIIPLLRHRKVHPHLYLRHRHPRRFSTNKCFCQQPHRLLAIPIHLPRRFCQRWLPRICFHRSMPTCIRSNPNSKWPVQQIQPSTSSSRTRRGTRRRLFPCLSTWRT